MGSELPEGFTLDQPQESSSTLPEGFTLDPVQEPVQPQVFKKSESLMKSYSEGSLKPEQVAAIDEAKKRGVLDGFLLKLDSIPSFDESLEINKPAYQEPETDPDEPGILDILVGAGEVGLMGVTGTVAEQMPTLTALGMTLYGDPEEQSTPESIAESMEIGREVEDAMTYIPKTKGGRVVLEEVGKLLKKPADWASKIYESAGETGYKYGGPVGGAAAKTFLAAIPEVLGLKGSKQAKKLAIKRVLKKQNIESAYDEIGNLLPEIQKGLDDAGINIKDVEDILPKPTGEEELKTAAEQIGEAAKTRIRPEAKAQKIAEDVKPSAEILEAAEELGMSENLLASHTSQNPTFIAIEQGLKSIPGSQLADKEKLLVSSLAKEADDLILEFGGEIDKSSLSDQFRFRSKNIVSGLEDSAYDAYEKVNAAIPKNTKISADNTIKRINEIAEELGGGEYLDAKEASLLKTLDPATNPTYARLDKFRKQIGSALRKNTGPFKDADEGMLKQIYKSLAIDQQAAASKAGAGDLYKVANDLVISRKTIEKQLQKTIGKELTGSITAKARPAMLGLQKGDTKQFDDLIENIPEEVGPELKKSIVVSALNDAFVQGSRAERSLNLPGFDDFMVGLKRHKGSYNRLKENIGANAMKRLELLHTVGSGVSRAQKSAITTGRIAAVPGMFDSADNLASRLYGTVKKVATAEGVTTAMGAPGVGTAGVLGAAISAKRGARSVAADEFLASTKFRALLRRKAAGRFDTAEKIKQAEASLEKIKQYQKWKNTLPEKDLKDLAMVGAIGYLTGETVKGEEK